MDDGDFGGPEGSVFTLGFAAATTDLSSYAVSPLTPPDLQRQQQQQQQQQQHLRRGSLDNSSSTTKMPKGLSKKEVKRLKKFSSDAKSRRRDHNSNHRHISRNSNRRNSHRDVRSLLKGLSLDHYAEVFEREEVDLEALKELSEGDLADLGIKSAEARAAIMGAVCKI